MAAAFTGLAIISENILCVTVKNIMQTFGDEVTTNVGPGSSSPFPLSSKDLFLTSNTSGNNLVALLQVSAPPQWPFSSSLWEPYFRNLRIKRKRKGKQKRRKQQQRQRQPKSRIRRMRRTHDRCRLGHGQYKAIDPHSHRNSWGPGTPAPSQSSRSFYLYKCLFCIT